MIYATGILAVLLAAAVYALVTERKRKQALLELKKSFEIVCLKANDPFFAIDISNGNIFHANERAAELLGYPMETITTKNIFDLHPPEYLQRSSEVIADIWEQGGLVYQDVPLLTSSGQVIPVECSGKVLAVAGKPAVVIYARDIRERLRMEKEIREAKEIIELKNKDIVDSINYARRIQVAILPGEELIRHSVPKCFVLYRPKDIVSGDFYWFSKRGSVAVVAAVDCTGHGVPGAFMSMIGTSLLNELVDEKGITRPADILDNLRSGIISALRQHEGGTSTKDGMDITLFTIDYEKDELQFAGAYNPLFIARKNGMPAENDLITNGYTLSEIKANRFPIGVFAGGELQPFGNHTIKIFPGDRFYASTDGVPDQFGGPKGKKLMNSGFRELILSMQHLPITGQKETMDKAIDAWIEYPNGHGIHEQMDDICVIGVEY